MSSKIFGVCDRSVFHPKNNTCLIVTHRGIGVDVRMGVLGCVYLGYLSHAKCKVIVDMYTLCILSCVHL